MISIERRIQNWMDFVDMSSEINRLLVVTCSENIPPRPQLWWEYADKRVEWAYRQYEQQLRNIEVIDDNSIPHVSLITGTEIFAEAFGCKVYKPDNNNPCAIPFVHSIDDLKNVKMPSIDDTNLTILFDMADKLKAKAGKDVLIAMPDIQSPMDIAALIWEKSDFFAAMYDEPEAVKQLSSMIREFMFTFFDEWFRRYGKAFIAHYPEYYMSEGITMSEDEIGCVSVEMFETFFADELNAFSKRYGGIGIHCCADSMHQWENLKNIYNLKLLNLNKDKKTFREPADFFCGSVAQYMVLQDNRLAFSHNPNKECHVANQVYVSTIEEAKRIVENVRLINV